VAAEGCIGVERDPGGVAVVTIDRPAKRNALTPAMFEELTAVMGGLAADEELRACVLTGAGETFTAGGDIAAFADLDGDAARRAQVERAFAAFRAVEELPVPVIAAVDGAAHGGGTELVLAADLAIASTRASFALPELTVGLVAGFGIDRAVPHLGRGRAAWLALLAEPIDAAQALDWGLVQLVVEPQLLGAAARDVAGRIAARPPAGVRAAKRLLREAGGPDGLVRAADAIVELFGTEDHRAAVERFRA
jgi:enoyl-CoA hydratase/carnithine racemase